MKQQRISKLKRAEILEALKSQSLGEVSKRFGVPEAALNKLREEGVQGGISVSLEEDYVTVRIPRKQLTKQLLSQLL